MEENENGSNGSNGSHGSNETGEASSKSRRKRVLVKDVTSRVEALENRLVEIGDELLKLDRRIQKIADSITQEQANRWTSN
jgi:methyl-accepting chemotaxis protein